MAPPDVTDLDLLDRARAGDRAAFEALATTWARPALRVTLALTGDRRRARIAARNGFTGVYRRLPSHHSRAPFRPMVLGEMGRAAVAASAPTDGLAAALAAFPDDPRIAVVLAGLGYRKEEVGLALGLGRRAVGGAIRSASAIASGRPLADVVAEAARDADALVGSVPVALGDDPIAIEVRRRSPLPPIDVWRTLTDPHAVATWFGERVRLLPPTTVGPGTRVTAIEALGSGRVAQRCRILLAEHGRSLAWTAALRLGWAGADVEQVFTVRLEDADGGTELIHVLRGYATLRGLAGDRAARRYDRLADSVAPSMHRRLARIASAAEAGARGTTRGSNSR